MKQTTTKGQQMDRITDTIPASIFDGVTRYYARQGYRLDGFLLVTSGTYSATFVKA